MSKGVVTIMDSYNANLDKYLAASDMLAQRLSKIRLTNELAGLADPVPTLRDVQATHGFLMATTMPPHVAVAYEYFKTPGMTTSLLQDQGSTVKFTLSSCRGEWLNDQVLRVVLAPVGDPAAPATAPVRYRYTDLPGLRLVERAAFRVKNVDLADYTYRDNLFLDTITSDEKSEGLARMLGQQPVKTGEYFFADHNVNQLLQFTDGAQTPQPFQPALELWIPLFFWFNRSVRSSFCNARVGTQEIEIEIKLAPLEAILQAVGPTGEVIPNALKMHAIETLDLYTKNIYTNAEVRDLFAGRPQLSLVRLRRRHEEIITAGSGRALLSQLKYAIEYLQFGFQPVENDARFADWHRLTRRSTRELPIPAMIKNPLITPVHQLVVRTATFSTHAPAARQIGLFAHGNAIYPLTPAAFFNRHVPYTNPDLTVPRDPGKYTASFALLPGSAVISGHFNNSVAREFYIAYEVDASTARPLRLIVTAVCLNFIVYNGESVYIKYST